KCWFQSMGTTPRPTWNPDIPQPLDFFQGWQEVPDGTTYDNAFKIQWEFFLKHVALGTEFPWTLREGAKGVQLAELGLQSWQQRRWLPVEDLPLQ
ncbi:MAG: gfo/Idh/MocA family oxidoreductase, partial [bacterium]|nr:gfo/Idh/MocA family oxidoreductase [bacterium]